MILVDPDGRAIIVSLFKNSILSQESFRKSMIGDQISSLLTVSPHYCKKSITRQVNKALTIEFNQTNENNDVVNYTVNFKNERKANRAINKLEKVSDKLGQDPKNLSKANTIKEIVALAKIIQEPVGSKDDISIIETSVTSQNDMGVTTIDRSVYIDNKRVTDLASLYNRDLPRANFISLRREAMQKIGSEIRNHIRAIIRNDVII